MLVRQYYLLVLRSSIHNEWRCVFKGGCLPEKVGQGPVCIAELVWD